jgi:glycerophosphoryl diester phosphodiesterase
VRSRLLPRRAAAAACATHRALLSAHRGAAGQLGLRDNSWEALQAAVALPVEFVEFDVHRTADGHYILHHLDHVRIGRRKLYLRHLSAQLIGELVGHEMVEYADALALLAEHGKKAHIDLKFTSPLHRYEDLDAAYEVEVARIARAVMGSGDRFILTSLVDRTVQVLAKWAATESPETLVGLSLGLGVWRLNWWAQVLLRASEIFPAKRLRSSGATLVVVQHRLASLRVLRWAAAHGMPVLVWTVDRPRRLRRFMADGRVWMVTSNHPSRAASARDYDQAA